MSAAETLCPEGAEAIQAQLRSDAPFVVLQENDTARRAALLEAVVDGVRDGETKVVWAGNPLRAPLTIERILLQVVGADVDLRVEHSPADLARMLAKSAGEARRLLIVLQQPETLDAEARETIAELAETLRWVDPAVQFLFCGTAGFQLPSSPCSAPRTADPIVPMMPPLGRAEPRRWLEAWPLVLLLACVAVGAIAYPKLAEPPLSSQATIAPKLDIAALRREFDTFLAAREGKMPPMSDEQKDLLFQEFLDHRRQMTDTR